VGPGDSGGAITRRDAVADLAFEGVELLPRRWSEVGDALLDRWWAARIAASPDFAARAGRVYEAGREGFAGGDARDLRALFDDHGRARLLCATRVGAFATSADALNERLLARLRRETPEARGSRRARELAIGAPVAVQHNDYDRGLFNGDQGVVVRVRSEAGDPAASDSAPQPMAVFPRAGAFDAFPLEVLGDLAPAFAMTVHKAQGSEFDHVAVVLPEADLPLLTRELLYTAITRARRSVLIVGEPELLARAVSRTIERSSGVAERLRRRH
jgi:exodeoxyribonuclease V alpha subunit